MSTDQLPDVRAPRDDLALVELSIQDAREYLPADRDRIAYHLREAQQLLDAAAAQVWVAPAATATTDRYHTDPDCRHLDGVEGVRRVSVAQIGRRECCRECAGDGETAEADWGAYRTLRDAEAER
jgi:hypothetical protein